MGLAAETAPFSNLSNLSNLRCLPADERLELARRKESYSHLLASFDHRHQNFVCHSAFDHDHRRALAALGHRHAPVEMSGGAQVHVFPTHPAALKAEIIVSSFRRLAPPIFQTSATMRTRQVRSRIRSFATGTEEGPAANRSRERGTCESPPATGILATRLNREKKPRCETHFIHRGIG